VHRHPEPHRPKEDQWVPMTLSELDCALLHAMAVYGDLGEQARECGHNSIVCIQLLIVFTRNVLQRSLPVNATLTDSLAPTRTPPNCARSVLPPKSIPQYCLAACKTKVPWSDIIMANWTAGVHAPAHAVFWDRNANNIVVSIR